MKRAVILLLFVAACSSHHHKAAPPPRRTVTPPSTFSVTVHWNFSPTKTVTGYRVYRGTVLGHESQLLGTVGPKIKWWVDNAVPYIPTGNYIYRVRAFSPSGTSAKSAPMVANGQGVPTDPLKDCTNVNGHYSCPPG